VTKLFSKKSIRETLTGASIVASLIFVGYEIQQNTIAARASAYQSLGIATAQAWDSWAHDRQFQIIHLKPPEALNAEDWMQLLSKLTVFARLGETIQLQVEQGLLPPDSMEKMGYHSFAGTIKNSPVYYCCWEAIRLGVSDSYGDYMEAIIGTPSVDCSSYEAPWL